VSVFVIDASVVVKWFVPEIHSDAARRLLTVPHVYLAPDLLFAEAANAIWKKVRRGELSGDEGRRLVADIARVAVDTISCRSLTADAYVLADAIGRPVYDALYLTLAARLGTRMITADDRLQTALAVLPAMAAQIQHVQAFER
jgi:predicted nucleic acid-binding protein